MLVVILSCCLVSVLFCVVILFSFGCFASLKRLDVKVIFEMIVKHVENFIKSY